MSFMSARDLHVLGLYLQRIKTLHVNVVASECTDSFAKQIVPLS